MTRSALMAPEKIYAIEESELVLQHGDRPYVVRIKDLPVEEKPREKLLKYGPGVLNTAELMAVVLGVGTKKEDVLQMAKRLVKDYGETAIVNEKDPKRIMRALNLPQAKACQLVASFELGRRFFKVSAHPAILRTARQVYEHVKHMHDLPKEHLRGLYLDAHYRVLHEETLSIGSVASSIVHPREVFRPAVEYAASAVILVHNHPSGVVEPSGADLEVTRQLIEAGKIMGVHLLDHIIVGPNKFKSILANYE